MEIYIFFYKLICVIYGYVIFLYNLDLYWYVFESKGFIYFLDILRWFIDMYFGKSSCYEKF